MENYQILNAISRLRHYSFLSAVSDITGIGTLYGLGEDFAHKHQLEKMKNCTDAIDQLDSVDTSILQRVTYLSSLATLGGGLYFDNIILKTVGMVASCALGLSFIAKAGAHSNHNPELKRGY